MSTTIKDGYKIADVEELPFQVGRVMNMDGKEIAVFRLSNGDVKALENRCPKGGPIAEGIVSGEYVYTPLYDWKISLTDGQVQAPDTGQVKIYPVEVRDGLVYIMKAET